jgi:Transglycosylase SLT domain
MLLSLPQSAWGSDSATISRCKKYLPTVIRESRYALGMDSPYWMFMGQGEQESRCQAGITAFDGGQGWGQFMPATAEDIQRRESELRKLGAQPMPYDPTWSIRALILYDRYLYGQTDCTDWYFAFRAYNGGVSGINREIASAKSCVETDVEKQCRRRILTLKNGSKLDLCTVNIEYPKFIFERAVKYKPKGVN